MNTSEQLKVFGEMSVLQKALDAWEASLGRLEAKISNRVEFDFNIFYQNSDGFVILNIEKAELMPLKKALQVINRDGSLSESNFESF